MHRATHWVADSQERWRRCIPEGLTLLEYVTAEAARQNVDVDEVDAFACPGLFGPADRALVDGDRDRYRRPVRTRCGPTISCSMPAPTASS